MFHKYSTVVLLLAVCLISGCKSDTTNKTIEPFTLYEKTIPNNISCEIYDSDKISINQGSEYLTEDELLFSTDGLRYTQHGTTFGDRSYFLKASSWEDYVIHIEREVAKYNGDPRGCYMNEGMWKAFSNIVIETDKWRIAVITPNDIVTTSKDGQDHYVVFNDISLNNGLKQRAIMRHDTFVIYGDTSHLLYDFDKTPSFTNITKWYCIANNEPIARFSIPDKYDYGCDTISFSVQELPYELYLYQFKVTDELPEHRPTEYATITVSTSDLGPDWNDE